MVFKGQNNRIVWGDEGRLFDGLDNILLEEEESKKNN